MQHRSEETRERILTTAEDLFARQGFDATGISEICAGAGVSKGAFYFHFPSKLAVFQALLDKWLILLDQILDAGLASGKDIPTGLINMAANTRPMFSATGSHARIILEFWIQAGRQPGLWKTAVAPYHRYLERFAGLFQQAVDDGVINQDIPPQATAHLVMAMAMGMLLQAFLDPEGANWSEITQTGMHTILAGLLRRRE